MSTFQNMRDEAEQKVLVQLLSEIERNCLFTQRTLANELGIALGMMNQYLKHCITKGWIRASQVAPRRITYFLTPEGFHEKSRMITAYLGRSMTFFRDARTQIEAAYEQALEKGALTVGLVGAGDLADIAHLVAQGTPLKVILLNDDSEAANCDMILLTDIVSPQAVYDRLSESLQPERILTLDLLHINRVQRQTGTPSDSEEDKT